MAKIFPEHLPQSVLDDPFRNAERKVYEQLSQLSDQYTIYYSVPWQTHTRRAGVTDGEADFVIAHPQMGIVFLEVKGGEISYDPSENQWYTTGGISIKDPLEQGRKSQYALLDRLQALPGWDANRYLNIGHAVCFPSVYVKERILKPDLQREILLDRGDLEIPALTVPRLFKHLFGENFSRGAPGIDRLQVIEKLLASSFHLRSPLGVELEYEDAKLVELTDAQMLALSFLGDRKRVAIAGCAGSGKTMLAIEKALRLQSLGLKVLLTCFNIPLAHHLQKRLDGKAITIRNFHTLAEEILDQQGVSITAAQNEKEYYDRILPETLWEAATNKEPEFDAIIVDEGQDFRENYWIALHALLKPDGYLYVFFDDNQNLYGGVHGFASLMTEPPFSLNQNCRNTRSIHQTVIKFHNNPTGIVCRGPDGRPPELLSYETEEELLRLLQKLLNKLIHDEHVRSEEIAILTPRAQDKSMLKAGRKLGNFTLTHEPPGTPFEIQATSIHRFKGLERRVIILGELDYRYNYNPEMIMYVGCSRARTQLYILHGQRFASEILARLQERN